MALIRETGIFLSSPLACKGEIFTDQHVSAPKITSDNVWCFSHMYHMSNNSRQWILLNFEHLYILLYQYFIVS